MDKVLWVLRKYDRCTDRELFDEKIDKKYLRLWGFMGLWSGGSPKEQRFQYYFPRCVITLAVLDIVKCAYSFALEEQHLTGLVKHSMMVFIAGGIAVKLSTMVSQRDRLAELCGDIEGMYSRQWLAGDPQVVAMIRDARLFGRYISFYLPVYTYAMLMLANVGLVLGHLSNRRTLEDLTYPCDAAYSPCFEVIFLFEFIYSQLGAPLIGFSDVFLVDILWNVFVQFNILNHNLSNITSYASEKVEKDYGLAITLPPAARECDVVSDIMHSDLERNVGETLAGSEVVTVDMAGSYGGRPIASSSSSYRGSMSDIEPPGVLSLPIEMAVGDDDDDGGGGGGMNAGIVEATALSRMRTVGNTILAVERISDQSSFERGNTSADRVARDEAMSRELDKRLKECVQHHQELISLMDELEALFQPFLMTQLCCNILITVTTFFHLSVKPKWDNIDLVMAVVVILVSSELFQFCNFAEKVEEASSRVGESIFSSDWTGATEGFKRSMRIIISMSNNPVLMSVVGFVPLSMETFATTMQSCYSYIAALTTLQGD